jgi:hypothetical protein
MFSGGKSEGAGKRKVLGQDLDQLAEVHSCEELQISRLNAYCKCVAKLATANRLWGRWVAIAIYWA